MKLWEIKAQSLRLMFADSDLEFSEDEFENGILMSNGNTREKLVRMNDSIRRAIAMYYSYVGEFSRASIFTLMQDGSDYLNKIDVSASGIQFPTRVDILFYQVHEDETRTLVKETRQINYSFDSISKEITFYDEDFSSYEDAVEFRIWYKMEKENLPLVVDDMTWDLDEIHLPYEVQLMLPYYVKGELYEEDEPNLALMARSQYIQFLSGLRKPFQNVQTKVRRARIFDK